MIITDPTLFTHKNALSASKIDSFQHCSQKFGARYLFSLPDIGNSGSSRGSVCHFILELLILDRRRDLVKRILRAGTCVKFEALWRLICKYAKKYNVHNSDDLLLIDNFLITGLKFDFYGPAKTEKILVEKAFDFEVKDETRDYRIRGLIDKIFFVRGTVMPTRKEYIYLEIADYKSSKAKFDAKKIESSVQASMYQLALKYLYPELELKRFHFLFLKFPEKPVQEFNLLDDNMLYGFEMFLTEMQKQIDNFTEKNLMDNLGSLKPETFRLCGKPGMKSDGVTPNFMCPARNPVDYYVVIDDKGNQVASAFTKKELREKGKSKPDDKIEKRFYSGCGYFFDKTGKPRKLSQD